MKKLLMELLGTFFFVLSVAMTGNPFAFGFMLMAWVYIGNYISGAHYNPMVSLAMAIRQRLAWQELPKYMLAQILGSVAGFGVTYILEGHIAIAQPAAHLNLWQAGLIELLLAFGLAMIILVVGTSERFRNNDIFGVAIGFTIAALAIVGGPLSGGVFNPAITLGSCINGLVQGVEISYMLAGIYIASAFAGGALAAYAFKYFFNESH